MLLFIKMGDEQEDSQHNFNTSHVTVYPSFYYIIIKPRSISIHLMLLFILTVITPILSHFIFQYISCYCLSPPTGSPSKHHSKFQYISCYCLSCTVKIPVYNLMISIHLMLLFIVKTCSNTKHVNTISIHLMLLFISYQYLDMYH